MILEFPKGYVRNFLRYLEYVEALDKQELIALEDHLMLSMGMLKIQNKEHQSKTLYGNHFWKNANGKFTVWVRDKNNIGMFMNMSHRENPYQLSMTVIVPYFSGKGRLFGSVKMLKKFLIKNFFRNYNALTKEQKAQYSIKEDEILEVDHTLTVDQYMQLIEHLKFIGFNHGT